MSVAANVGWALVEQALGADPEFGDSTAIEARALARLRVGLAALGTNWPEQSMTLNCVEASDDALLAMLRDPVLRNAFEMDLASAVEREPAATSSLLNRLLAENDCRAGHASRTAVGTGARSAWPRSGSAWVWMGTPERSGSLAAVRLEQLARRQFPASTAEVPLGPSADNLRTLELAAELLTTVLPTVGPGVLRHIGMVGLARGDSQEGPLHSVSGGDHFPAAIFLSPDELDNVWDAAGALLHEGLHLTLFEVIRCGALTAEHVDVHAPEVPIPWRVQAWSIMRVLFALHVYVHLALFHEAARSAPRSVWQRFGEPPQGAALSQSTPKEGAQFRTSFDRARYLADQLMLRTHLLTPYGRRLVVWLTEALERFATSQSRSGLVVSYRAVESVGSVHLPEQKRVVLAIPNPLRLLWLNVSSWLVYALCDGRGREAILNEYLATVADTLSADEAKQHVDAALSMLVEQNLVVANYHEPEASPMTD